MTTMTHQGDPDRSFLSGFELSTVDINGLSVSEDQMMRDPVKRGLRQRIDRRISRRRGFLGRRLGL